MGLSPAELAALRDQVDYTVYTPGSTAGEPVNLLASFDAPADWDLNREGQRERIASIVTALLGLVGMDDVDPLRSREHILLANILESAWSRGQSLDLGGLIEQVPRRPLKSWALSRWSASSLKKTVSSWLCCSTTSWPRPPSRPGSKASRWIWPAC